MFRRSSSSSNIPVPKTNLFNNKDAKTKVLKRSQSTTRLSQRDSASSVSQPRTRRNSSLERKSSNVGLLRTTPLPRVGGRSGSLQKTTPISAIKRAGGSRGTTPSSCRKEHVTIQKLSTDKRWVAEQYVKVQNFIVSSELFDMGVVNTTNIKPPSINAFIYVTGIMLMEIFPMVKISKENYKEVIPAQLKVLRYPGTMTNSLLKTVNTMHSWPQIIGMWSWLIDKVNLTTAYQDEISLERFNPEDKTKILLAEHKLNFLVRRYQIFNKNELDNSDEIEKTNNDYVQNLAEPLNVNFERFEQLQQHVTKMREYRDNQEQEVKRLNSENMKITSEIEEMKKEISEFQENGPTIEKDLDEDLELLQSKLKERWGTIDSIKKNISRLREAIKEQPCSYETKQTLLKQIEQLKKEIEVKREKIEHARKIKDKFDHKLSTELNKIQSLVINWNRSLMEISIKKPFLKNLLLREKGFHDPEFLQELQNWSDNKITIEKEVLEAIKKIGEELAKAELRKREVEKEIQKFDDTLYHIMEECKLTETKIREINDEIEKLTKDLEEKKASYNRQVNELNENDVLEIQTKTIAELKREKEHLAEEVKKFGVKMLSFFLEMNNQIVTDLKMKDEIKSNLLQRKLARRASVVESQRKIIESLKSLDT